LGFLTVSCKEKQSPYLLRDTLQTDQFIFIDTLKEIAIRNYVVDPDTAEFLLNQATRACDSIGLQEKMFQILLEKAEFYQYRKPDFLKSVKNLSKAVTIFIQHPGPYAEDPYIYINIGNFFYRIHYYEKARTFYQLGMVVAHKIKLVHAEAIAVQNIGLTFQQLNRNDSALTYFKKGLHEYVNVGYLTRALNFFYLAGNYLKTGKMDSVSAAVDSGFTMVQKFKNQQPSDLGTVYPKLLVNCQEIESNLHYLLHQYNWKINQHDPALKHFETALIHARKIQSNTLLSSLLYEKVRNPAIERNGVPDEILADSVLFYSKLINDPFYLQQMTDSLARHFSGAGNRMAFEKYAALDRSLADSLEKLRNSRELFENEILLSSVIAEQVIQKLNFEKAENQRSMKYYRMLVLFILAIAALTNISLYIIIRQYRGLQLAYSNLTGRIRQSVSNEQAIKPQSNLPSNDSIAGIIKNLEHLMGAEKIFLNQELTLNELATLLQTNRTYLSGILNQQFGMNFNEYVNQFRVKEACRLILDTAAYNSSFDHILEKSGFHNKSTFYLAFKKFTGMSPATFLKKVKKSHNPNSPSA
jgi:YesN/AraC family two-component response regulator